MATKLEYKYEPSVYVYEAPVRIVHWVVALAITVLCVTGYFIGTPLPSMPGEASDNFLMGYIRFAHFSAGYILAVAFLGRIYWVIVGNNYARQIFFPPIFSKDWWEGVWHEIKWYSFVVKEPRSYAGHNPLAVLAMNVMFVWGTIFMLLTGFALYGEGTGMGSWQYDWFSSWVIPLFGQSQDVHTWHRVGMWYLICFIIVHIYVAAREDIMSRTSVTSSMISGWRNFYDNREIDEDD